MDTLIGRSVVVRPRIAEEPQWLSLRTRCRGFCSAETLRLLGAKNGQAWWARYASISEDSHANKKCSKSTPMKGANTTALTISAASYGAGSFRECEASFGPTKKPLRLSASTERLFGGKVPRNGSSRPVQPVSEATRVTTMSVDLGLLPLPVRSSSSWTWMNWHGTEQTK